MRHRKKKKDMKRLIARFAWWVDGICHRIIEWADPLTEEEIAKIIENLKKDSKNEER